MSKCDLTFHPLTDGISGLVFRPAVDLLQLIDRVEYPGGSRTHGKKSFDPINLETFSKVERHTTTLAESLA